MNGFISNILSRHTDTVANIIPRLPAKFEPVNFPAANSTEAFSVRTEANHPFNIVQPNIESSIENKKVADINPGKSTTMVNSSIVNDQNIQPINNNNTVFNKSSNTGQTSNIKNIIPADKEVDENINGENISKVQRSVFNEIKTGNQFKEKPLPENFDEQELTGKVWMNKQPMTLNGKDDMGDEHGSRSEKNIIKPVTTNGNHFLEKVKHVQGGLIKPSIQNLNAGVNPNTLMAQGEQNMSSVIKINIGRIEVRAVTAPAPVKINRPVLQKPRLSLDEYLKNRNGAEK